MIQRQHAITVVWPRGVGTANILRRKKLDCRHFAPAVPMMNAERAKSEGSLHLRVLLLQSSL
jgi:hypothetical protein